MEKNVLKEVVELHQFFENWFTARLDNTEENLNRFEHVTSDEFTVIPPNGATSDKASLIKDLQSAYGFQGQHPYRIEIKNVEEKELAGDLVMATFEEWQQDRRENRGHLNTAIFRRNYNNVNGLEWVHLHKTRIPESAQLS